MGRVPLPPPTVGNLHSLLWLSTPALGNPRFLRHPNPSFGRDFTSGKNGFHQIPTKYLLSLPHPSGMTHFIYLVSNSNFGSIELQSKLAFCEIEISTSNKIVCECQTPALSTPSIKQIPLLLILAILKTVNPQLKLGRGVRTMGVDTLLIQSFRKVVGLV